jgi:hypothetical protein
VLPPNCLIGKKPVPNTARRKDGKADTVTVRLPDVLSQWIVSTCEAQTNGQDLSVLINALTGEVKYYFE